MLVIDCKQPTLEVIVTPPGAPNGRDGAAPNGGHGRNGAPPREKPPIVFVHGAFAGAWCWEEFFVPYFSGKGYTTVSFSLRGHGESEGWETLDLATLSDYVDDLASVTAALAHPPILVGHSMGGMVVQKYLETRTAAAMVLMSSVGPWGLLESSWHMMLSSPRLAHGLSLMQLWGLPMMNPDVLYEGLFSTAVPRDRAERYFRRFQRESQRVIMDMTWWDVPRQPPRTPLPTLVMGAGEDAFIPRTMVHRTARYLDADAVMVPDMAHAMMLEETWYHAAEPILHWLHEKGL